MRMKYSNILLRFLFKFTFYFGGKFEFLYKIIYLLHPKTTSSKYLRPSQRTLRSTRYPGCQPCSASVFLVRILAARLPFHPFRLWTLWGLLQIWTDHAHFGHLKLGLFFDPISGPVGFRRGRKGCQIGWPPYPPIGNFDGMCRSHCSSFGNVFWWWLINHWIERLHVDAALKRKL